MIPINKLIGLVLFVVVLSLVVLLVCVFTVGGENITYVMPKWPVPPQPPAPSPQPPAPPPTEDYVQPLLQPSGSPYEFSGPAVCWNETLRRGCVIRIYPETSGIISIHFFRLSNENIVVFEETYNVVDIYFYLGTSLKIMFDRNHNRFIAVLTGQTYLGRGKILFYILSFDRTSWDEPTNNFLIGDTVDDQFGKSVAMVFNFLSSETFMCFGASTAVSSAKGSVKVYTFDPNAQSAKFVFSVSIELPDTITQDVGIGFANTLVSADNALLIGCPGFNNLDGSKGKIYYFLYNYTAINMSPWTNTQDIVGSGRFGDSMVLNSTGDFLVSASPLIQAFSTYRLINGAWQLQNIIPTATSFAGCSLNGSTDLGYLCVTTSFGKAVYRLNGSVKPYPTYIYTTPGDPQYITNSGSDLFPDMIPSPNTTNMLFPQTITALFIDTRNVDGFPLMLASNNSLTLQVFTQSI